MIELGMKVRFKVDDMVIVGKVIDKGFGAVLVEEIYAASVWGESTACAGHTHAVHRDEVEVVS